MSKKTPFYECHKKHNAKMVTFAGYNMPVSYTSIKKEHQTVRNAAGVFDVSHMGEFLVEGKAAEGFLQYLTINDISQLSDGQAQYSAMCYPDGGIVDDLIIYRFNSRKFMMVVNASNIDKDLSWAQQHVPDDAKIINVSDKTALLAVQGPKCLAVLQELTGTDLKNIGFYHFIEGELAGRPMLISRTGYTGEPGFELYHAPEDALHLWESLFENGKKIGLAPAGLGARDTLRIEMKYALYGNDIDKNTNPIEGGLSWVTKIDKGDFIGRTAIKKTKEEKPPRRLIAFKMLERGIPRPGYPLYTDNKAVGRVTSGTMSPTLNIGIGLAYVDRSFAKSGNELFLDSRGKRLRAKVIKPPFVDSSPLSL
ncbi:MAG: glycine cleavage system aminomethyltransferase GcvT [Candidatus Marinimicrobia bacterium]|nr:glycine cleavage system aminomethyltransferase GcvT [Candidatus Neomarinimicrobiota bacterium]